MKIHAITIDSDNPKKLASWWAEVLRVTIAMNSENIVRLAPSPFLPPIQFQKVESSSNQINRVHLDLSTLDIKTETTRLIKLGAMVIQKFELSQISHVTFLDPDGNKFDLYEESVTHS